MPNTKMTQEQFDALRPLLGRLSLDSIAVAQAVVVKGSKPSEAADAFGMSRQRVNGILQRFRASAAQVPTGWRYVGVWLPPEAADHVEALAQEIKAKHLAHQEHQKSQKSQKNQKNQVKSWPRWP